MHAVYGWYVVPFLHHQRNFKVWITKTSSELDTDTLSWFLSLVSMPHASKAKPATEAAQDLVTNLSNPSP